MTRRWSNQKEGEGGKENQVVKCFMAWDNFIKSLTNKIILLHAISNFIYVFVRMQTKVGGEIA